MDKRPSTWVTWLLIALNVAAFGVELAMGADPIAPKAQDVLRAGADYAPLTLHGESWRIVTSMFLHFGLIHIGMNMLCLAQGRIVEVTYGHLGFVAIYLVSGILGAVGSLAHAPNVVSAGASGAVFGVFGAFGALLLLRRDRIDPAVWQRSARSLGTFVGINLVIGYQSKGIDLTAHIVGMIAGFAVGAAQLVGKPSRKQYVPRALAALIAGIAITIVAVVTLPTPRSFESVFADFHQVEHECITAYNEHVRQLKDHQLAVTAFADAIDHEMLVPWRALRARIDAIPDADVPQKDRALLALMRTYLRDRQEAWEVRSELYRDISHHNQEDLANANQLMQRADDDIHAIDVEVGNLNGS